LSTNLDLGVTEFHLAIAVTRKKQFNPVLPQKSTKKSTMTILLWAPRRV